MHALRKGGRSLRWPLILCAVPLFYFAGGAPARAQGREDEIIANLASGRVIVHATKDGIAFATIEQPSEANSLPPRITAIDSNHIGVMFGAVEWILPGQTSKPVRVEKGIPHMGSAPGNQARMSPDAEPDLEMIGVAFLEKLRPLVEQLHHKIELGPDEPIFELVVIGYGPQAYGPEVWLYEYRVQQELLRGDYVQTRLLRPRTTQLYPPEKHEPKRLVEVRYPAEQTGATLDVMVRRNDPVIVRLADADARFAKVTEKLDAGQANSVKFADATDFLHAFLVATANKTRFALGQMEDQRGVAWVVPPEEPVERAKEEKGQDKDRSKEAPSLMRKPKP